MDERALGISESELETRFADRASRRLPMYVGNAALAMVVLAAVTGPLGFLSAQVAFLLAVVGALVAVVSLALESAIALFGLVHSVTTGKPDEPA